MTLFTDALRQLGTQGIKVYRCDDLGYVKPNQGLIGKDNAIANREGTSIRHHPAMIWQSDGEPRIEVYSLSDVTYFARPDDFGTRSYWAVEGRVNLSLLGFKEIATA